MDSANVISAASHVRGTVSGSGALTIDGRIDGGAVRIDGPVFVARSGDVGGPIEAAEVRVEGHVRGDVRGHEAVALGEHARVEGAVTAPTLTIHPGARIRGRLDMSLNLPAELARGRTRRSW